MAQDIFSTLPLHVRVEASSSLRRDVIGWGQSKPTGETLGKKVVVTRFACANTGTLAGDDPALDTTNKDNDSELKREAEEGRLCRLANVHDFLSMWQGSQNLPATQQTWYAQLKRMAAVGYSSDTEEINSASWSLVQHDSAAACKLSEGSPFPTALSANDLPGGQTQILNGHCIRRVDRHPVESDEDSSPESILDTENWLFWNADLGVPTDREDNCTAGVESDLVRDNVIEDPESPERQDVSSATNIAGLIRPTRMSQRQAAMELVAVNTMGRSRNEGIKKKQDRIRQYVSPPSLCSLTKSWI